MTDTIIKVYATYDPENDNLEITLKDKTKHEELSLSNKNGMDQFAMSEGIGNWVMDRIRNMIDDEKKFVASDNSSEFFLEGGDK